MNVEWLILADAAQVIGGKLYVIGGGWETLVVNTAFPTQQYLAIAASFRVPWNETDQRHAVAIEVANEDGQTLMQVGGQVEVGRPPGVLQGSEQRAQLAFGGLFTFDVPGNYAITARVEGQVKGHVTFRVLPGQATGISRP